MGLREARRWVLTKMAPRAGMATKTELYHIWDYDPCELDDALRSLRNLGIISYNGHFWYVVS